MHEIENYCSCHVTILHPARSASKKKSISVIICIISHLRPGRNNMLTIHKETLWEQRGTTWQLHWRPPNKCCLKLMLSNRLEHVYGAGRETHAQDITVQLRRFFFLARPSFSLHLSFSLLFLNTFLFLPSHFSIRQRKLEMQEHIVTVGCFHLRSHLWHGQVWATPGLRLKLGESDILIKMTKSPKELRNPQRTNWCFSPFVHNHMHVLLLPNIFHVFRLISQLPGRLWFPFYFSTVWKSTRRTLIPYFNRNKWSWKN